MVVLAEQSLYQWSIGVPIPPVSKTRGNYAAKMFPVGYTGLENSFQAMHIKRPNSTKIEYINIRI